ncbi:MAG TPA: site-2 protease family protein [Chloroflexota bacterium]
MRASPGSYKIATIRDIDIYVHWSWLLIFVFLTWTLGNYYYATFHSWSEATAYLIGAISAILLFVTVLLHELAHSFTARARGLPVHSITLFIFGGVSSLTQEPPNARTEFLVAAAGPLTSLVLAGIFFLLHQALSGGSSQVLAVLGYLASVNLLLALFNLIPGFPLDGGRVLRSIIWGITGNLRRSTRIASTIGQIIGYLFILGGLLEAFVGENLAGGIWLAFIGWFLQNAASASYGQAVMETTLRGVAVRDVMDRPPAAITPNTSVATLLHQHLLDGHQRAVTVEGTDGNLLGLVTMTDLRDLAPVEWELTPVSRVMTPEERVRRVRPDDDLQSAIRTLAENDYHQLPVMSDGHLDGMLNRAHVLQYLHVRRRLVEQGQA